MTDTRSTTVAIPANKVIALEVAREVAAAGKTFASDKARETFEADVAERFKWSQVMETLMDGDLSLRRYIGGGDLDFLFTSDGPAEKPAIPSVKKSEMDGGERIRYIAKHGEEAYRALPA